MAHKYEKTHFWIKPLKPDQSALAQHDTISAADGYTAYLLVEGFVAAPDGLKCQRS